MTVRPNWRGLVASFAAAMALLVAPAQAQAPSGQPLTIGFSMALTGPLSPNGKSALLGMKIWEEEINAKGGLLGRPVKLVYYDDQSQAAPVPGIYTKLIDVDKVDLVIGPYATVPSAAAMPVIMQKGKVFIILFGLGVNTEFKYPEVLRDDPVGTGYQAGLHRRLLRGGGGTESQAADGGLHRRRPGVLQERLRRCQGQCQEAGLRTVYDRTYPPAADRFHAHHPRDPGGQSRCRDGLLLSARIRWASCVPRPSSTTSRR